MTAGAQLVATSGRAEWLEARRAGVTASEIASIMGIAPDSWETPFSLYQRKAGILPATDDADRLRLGRVLEPYVAELFAERNPALRTGGDGTALWASLARPWQMATPDRLVSCPGPPGREESGSQVVGVLECKTSATFEHWGDDGSDEIPVYTRAQILWQADVMGVDDWWAGCVFLPGGQFRVYHGTIDDAARADLQLMRAEAESFLERVERRIEPEPDWRPATGLALRQLHPDLDDTEARIPRAGRPVERGTAGRERRQEAPQGRRAPDPPADRPVRPCCHQGPGRPRGGRDPAGL